MRRPPDSRPSRFTQLQEPTVGSGRKRDPKNPCAGCDRPLKYDAKWPVCLACANAHLGIVGKVILAKRLDGWTRDDVLEWVDTLFDTIDGYVERRITPPTRRPRPGRSQPAARTRLRGPRRPSPRSSTRPGREQP